MCLFVDEKLTNDFKRKKGFVWAFKSLNAKVNVGVGPVSRVVKELQNGKVQKIRSIKLVAPYVPSFSYKSGWNKAEARMQGALFPTDGELYTSGVIRGGAIHVGRRKLDVQGGEFVVKVKCYMKDFLAVGTREDLAFVKVFLPKAEYDRIVKRVKNSKIKRT